MTVVLFDASYEEDEAPEKESDDEETEQT